MYETILVEKNAAIATVTLNRPERLNAVGPQMRKDILAALDDIDEDREIRVVILKGSGRAFCSGADIKDELAFGDRALEKFPNERHPGDTAYDWERVQAVHKVLWRIWDLKKIVIAQVHGYCIGFGINFITGADIVVIADNCKVGAPRSMVGAGVIGPQFVWSVGLKRAKWLELLPGWRITGAEAVDWGLASRAVPATELDAEVKAIADQVAVAGGPQLMLRKASLNRVWEQLGFRYSIAAGADFDPIAHKSDDGQFEERRSGEQGFIRTGAELLTRYPMKHGRA